MQKFLLFLNRSDARFTFTYWYYANHRVSEGG
jgi:hypothetical protein